MSSTARENQAISPSTGAQSPGCAMLYRLLDAQLSSSSTVRTLQRICCLMPDWSFHSVDVEDTGLQDFYAECFDILYNFCIKLSHYKKVSVIWSKLYTGLHVKYPPFLSDINETWISSRALSKYAQITKLMKIRPVLAELSHKKGRTNNHDKANCRFCQFCKRVEKSLRSQRVPHREPRQPGCDSLAHSITQEYYTV